MAKENVDIGQLIEEETERRLEEMARPDYEWPERAGRKDVIAIIVLMVICIGLIIGCMTGVIE